MDNPQHISSDFDPSLEDDQLWDVLGKTSSTEAPSNFVQNTVRAARLSNEEPKRTKIFSWLTKPAFTLGGLTAVVAITLFFLNQQSGDETFTDLSSGSNESVESDWLQQDMLTAAVEDPELFSDEEIVALVF